MGQRAQLLEKRKRERIARRARERIKRQEEEPHRPTVGDRCGGALWGSNRSSDTSYVIRYITSDSARLDRSRRTHRRTRHTDTDHCVSPGECTGRVCVKRGHEFGMYPLLFMWLST